ncbi:MAG: penicillin-binding protein activator [Myxococcales bacterium]|nr:penicillin-binding protein activator [Myxococcales bacterium]
MTELDVLRPGPLHVANRAALTMLAVALVPLAAFASPTCVAPERLAAATPELRQSLEAIDERCREGLELLAAGRPAEALPYLRGAFVQSRLMARRLEPAYAEAMYGSGAPVEATLVAYEAAAAVAPGPVADARLSELVLRLDEGRAAALLAAVPGRPAWTFLDSRAKRDAALDAQAPVATAVSSRRIGLLLPLGGKLGPFGRRIVDALTAELGPDVTLVVRDSTAQAVQTAVAELERERVLAIVGPLDHADAPLAAQAADARRVPLLRLEVRDDAPVAPGPWTVRLGPSRASELRALIAEGRRQGFTRMLVIGSDAPFAQSVAAAFSAEVRTAGLADLGRALYPAGTSDLTAVSKQVAQKRPDLLLLADTASKAGPLARYLAAAGIVTRATGRVGQVGELRQVQFAAPSEWLDTPIAAEDGRYLQSVWVATERAEVASPKAQALARTLGRGLTPLEGAAVDAVELVLNAGVTTREALIPQLRQGVARYGVLQPVAFDARGGPVRAARLLRLAGTTFAPVR